MKNVIMLTMMTVMMILLVNVGMAATVLNLGSSFPYNGTILRTLLIVINRQPDRLIVPSGHVLYRTWKLYQYKVSCHYNPIVNINVPSSKSYS